MKKTGSDVHDGSTRKMISVIVDKLPWREFISITVLISSKTKKRPVSTAVITVVN